MSQRKFKFLTFMQRKLVKQYDGCSIHRKVWKVSQSHIQFCYQTVVHLHSDWCAFTHRLHYIERTVNSYPVFYVVPKYALLHHMLYSNAETTEPIRLTRMRREAAVAHSTYLPTFQPQTSQTQISSDSHTLWHSINCTLHRNENR